MRPSIACLLSTFGIAALMQPVFAQQAQSSPGDAPPRLEKLEEGEPPAVTIRPPSNKGATEKRAPGGKRTQVKVTSGNSTYYLKPNDQSGSAQPGDAESIANRPAQWEVMTFDFNRARKEQQQAAAEAVEPAPAPPAVVPKPPVPASNKK